MALAYDWGTDRDEVPFEWGLSTQAAVVETDDETDLPNVRAAMAKGYEVAPGDLLWCFLPAIWPDSERVWTQDIRARQMQRFCDDGRPPQTLPWPTSTYFEIEADMNSCLEECGVGPRPPGRIWLLRLPPGTGPLHDVLVGISRSADAAGLDIMCTTAFAEHTQRELQRIFADGAAGQ